MVVLPTYATTFLLEHHTQEEHKQKGKQSKESFKNLLDAETERLEQEGQDGK